MSVRQISPSELKAMMDRGERFELVDVRTPEEHATARLAGARLLDRVGHDYLMALDRGTALVFQCHHGVRSQHAAEYFRREGFDNVANLQGGIDAWSLQIDPTIPRY